MRGPRRGRSPPPRRDERRYPSPPRDRRRPRSVTPPPDRFRRSPPPQKRYRRDDDPYDRPPRGFDPYERRGGPFNGRERFENDPRFRGDPYGRPPSPPPRDDHQPKTFKMFLSELADDVTPKEAQAAYQEYLAAWWGSELRAEFEARKNEEWMRRKYDPREQPKELEQRNAAAQAAAKAFKQALEDSSLNPHAEDFNQGMGPTAAVKREEQGDEAMKDSGPDGEAKTEEDLKPEQEPNAPEVCWKEDRIKADTALARQLREKLDAEKGIESFEIAALPKPEPMETGDEPAEDGAAEAKHDPADTKEKPGGGSGGGYDTAVAALDLLLTYLWRVHAVDYYGGRELSGAGDEEVRAATGRSLRGPRPEEGEQVEAAEEKLQLQAVQRVVDATWKKRLQDGDPLQALLQKDKVEKIMDDWVEEQIIKQDENKWGSKLSGKLFVAKEYVVKHVKLKHAHVVDEQRSKVLEEIYFENFKAEREEEEKRQQAELALQQAGTAGGAQMLPGGYWEGPPPGADGFAGGGFDGFNGGGEGFPPRPPPGRPNGRGGPGRQLSMPGMPGALGPRGIPGPMLDAGMMGPVLGGPGGGPPGPLLMLAPGAGPMGPFIPVPGAPPMGPPPGGPPRGRGRPGGPMMPPQGPMRGGGGRGGYNGPMGGGYPPKGWRKYVDLDAPENNRSVLDYGDL